MSREQAKELHQPAAPTSMQTTRGGIAGPGELRDRFDVASGALQWLLCSRARHRRRGWASPSRIKGDTIVASSASWDLPPCIGNRHIDIHVCEPDVAGDPGTALPDTLMPVLEGEGAGGQDPRGGTRGTVVTERVELPLTAASARRERENTSSEGPIWDSSSAREAGCEVGKESLPAFARPQVAGASRRAARGAQQADQSGASKPESQRCCAALSRQVTPGGSVSGAAVRCSAALAYRTFGGGGLQGASSFSDGRVMVCCIVGC